MLLCTGKGKNMNATLLILLVCSLGFNVLTLNLWRNTLLQWRRPIDEFNELFSRMQELDDDE